MKEIKLVSIPFSQAANTLASFHNSRVRDCFHSFQLGCKHLKGLLGPRFFPQFPFLLVRLQTGQVTKTGVEAMEVSIPFSQAANPEELRRYKHIEISFHSFQLGCKRGPEGLLHCGQEPFPFLLVRLQTGQVTKTGVEAMEVSIPFSQAANA